MADISKINVNNSDYDLKDATARAALVDFTGATASADGVTGLVPAPDAGDLTKVLYANGTWDAAPGARIILVETTVTNTSGAYTNTITDSRVEADMKAISLEIANPYAFNAPINITCNTGNIVISCADVTGSSIVKINIMKVDINSISLTSSEFDLLNSSKADKTDTVLNTTLSRGRYSESVGGIGSFAFGSNVIADGDYSQAVGVATDADGDYSHAEGFNTFALGALSHSEGFLTFAEGRSTHASGEYNEYNNLSNYSLWLSNKSYEAYIDSVIIENDNTHVYICTLSHTSGALFESNYWASTTVDLIRMKFAEIVGNGTSDSSRSNARSLDWEGNEYLKGTLKVNCNADSTGGSQVATLDNINNLNDKISYTQLTGISSKATLDAALDTVIFNLNNYSEKHIYFTSGAAFDVFEENAFYMGTVKRTSAADRGIVDLGRRAGLRTIHGINNSTGWHYDNLDRLDGSISYNGDLNTTDLKIGLYYYESTCLNKPTTSGGYFILIVLTSYIKLIAWSNRSLLDSLIYVRTYYIEGNSWPTWSRLTIMGDLSNSLMYYAACSTAAATLLKEVTIANFPSTLTNGLKICVYFNNYLGYKGTPTLKVNNFDAFDIYRGNTTKPALVHEWGTGLFVIFSYCDSKWFIASDARAATNCWGVTKLIDNCTTDDNTMALTAAQGKILKDTVDTKATKDYLGSINASSSGTITIANNKRGMVCFSGNRDGVNGMFVFYSNSGGGIRMSTKTPATDITLTHTVANEITVTNNNSATATNVYIIYF